jgi:hypothetical protein
MALKLLSLIARELDPPITESGLDRLSKRKDIEFPEAKKTIGRHRFYDEDEMKEWWSLWSQISTAMRERRNARSKSGAHKAVPPPWEEP